MKSKKIYYVLIFNLILFIGIIFNFYLKSETGKGMFYGLTSWWSEVNTVKSNTNIKLMSNSSENVEDPLEKIGKSSLETIDVKPVINIHDNSPNNEEVIVDEKKDSTPLKDIVVETKNNEKEKVKTIEKPVVSNESTLKKNEAKNDNKILVSENFHLNDKNEISDKTNFVKLKEEETPLCVNYGPLNIEQKSSFNILLAKYNVPNELIKKTEDDLYEIFWNLGSNKEVAVELFERQKNDGALQDVRFKLKQDKDGNYIVPISTVAGNLSMTNKMTQDLKNSSKNIGGIWEYRAIDKGYFYQISDIKKLDSELVNSINQVINTLKTTCN